MIDKENYENNLKFMYIVELLKYETTLFDLSKKEMK